VPEQPTLNQLNIIVRDMRATVDFYRLLGLEIPADHDDDHVEVRLANGLLLEFDAATFVHTWDGGWDGTTGSAVVIGFAVASREAVDAQVERIATGGFRIRQRPYDAFWGARYAIAEDPNGNGIGIMSPIDRDRKFWPPRLPSP
jgi:catechol 2,3-dioxygenase-like lactoylglutathione lyase family enzyme